MTRRVAEHADPENISVIVQGPIAGRPADPHARRLTLRGIESVRRHLPGAEIVVSTWKGADVTDLPFDRVVESDDPGGMRCDDWPNTRSAFATPYNANRQIVSTREGVRAATRPYAMKLRSDMMLTGTGFLDYFGRYPARNAEWRILRERVVAPNWFSRDPRGASHLAFHPSDWFHFGRTEDLMDLWDSPLTDAEMPLWFKSRPMPPEYGETHLYYRYTVEQYTWLAFLRKHGEVPFEHKLDANPRAVALSELALVNNLVIADIGDLGLRFLKYKSSLVSWGTLYTHGEWQRLYRQYCDPAFRPARDGADARKAAYNAVVAPVHTLLMSPRQSALGRAVSTAWETRHPRSFRAAKRLYVFGWSSLAELLRRRA